MSLSILPSDDQIKGGIWCATDMPFYNLFKNLLTEIGLLEKGEFIISDKEKLNKLNVRLYKELSEMIKKKEISSKRKSNFEFEGKFYNLNMRHTNDAIINNLLITKSIVNDSLEQGINLIIVFN